MELLFIFSRNFFHHQFPVSRLAKSYYVLTRPRDPTGVWPCQVLLLDLGVTSASTSSSQVQILAAVFPGLSRKASLQKLCTKKESWFCSPKKNWCSLSFFWGKKGCVIVFLRSGNEGTTWVGRFFGTALFWSSLLWFFVGSGQRNNPCSSNLHAHSFWEDFLLPKPLRTEWVTTYLVYVHIVTYVYMHADCR